MVIKHVCWGMKILDLGYAHTFGILLGPAKIKHTKTWFQIGNLILLILRQYQLNNLVDEIFGANNFDTVSPNF